MLFRSVCMWSQPGMAAESDAGQWHTTTGSAELRQHFLGDAAHDQPGKASAAGPCEAMQIMSHSRFFPGSDEPLTGGESLRHYRNKWNTSWLGHLADFVDAFLYYRARLSKLS